MSIIIHSNEVDQSYEHQDLFWISLKNNLEYLDYSAKQLRASCPPDYLDTLNTFITDLWNSLTGVFTKTASYSSGEDARQLGQKMYEVFPTPQTISEITYGADCRNMTSMTGYIPPSLLRCPCLSSFVRSYNAIIHDIKQLTQDYNKVLSTAPQTILDTEVLLTVLTKINCIFNANNNLIDELQKKFFTGIDETLDVYKMKLKETPEDISLHENLIDFFNIDIQKLLETTSNTMVAA